MEYLLSRSFRIIIPANLRRIKHQQFDALRKLSYTVNTEVSEGTFESVLTIRGTADGCIL